MTSPGRRDLRATNPAPEDDAQRRRAVDVMPRNLRAPSLSRQTRLIAGRFLLFDSLAK